MKTPTWDSLSSQQQDRIQRYLDGSISQEDFAHLQDELAESSTLRRVLRRALSVEQFLTEEAENQSIGDSDKAFEPWLVDTPREQEAVAFPSFPKLWPIALAASLAFGLGLFLMALRQDQTTPVASTPVPSNTKTEAPPSLVNDFAVVDKLLDIEWGASSYQEGETLGAEMITLNSGLAQIQFYSGATMTVEGPAQIELKSAWEAFCHRGAVRMRVPPAARGFRLNAPDTQIVDLGTEFGLNVSNGQGHVAVFDGEIALAHRNGDEQILEEGDALTLAAQGTFLPDSDDLAHFPDTQRFGELVAQKESTGFQDWQEERDAIARDERVAAYFTFEQKNEFGLFPNLTDTEDYNLNAAPILAETVPGRWPDRKSALEFRRPDARVRLHVPGSFQGFTFMSWVRIDSLDRDYSALFMADGYENGEPHWQIRKDGRMMLSVMIDDARPSIYKNDVSGYHYVYLSPPIWHQKLSGKWLHLASTYDPADNEVAHYLNGELLSREVIQAEWQPRGLTIGNGEIGNWGHANRDDSRYAIRSVNGSIGELAIFREALSEEEIHTHFQRTSTRPR